MIYQRPSALSIRDRDIALMPIAVERRGEHPLVSLLLWLAMAAVVAAFWVVCA